MRYRSLAKWDAIPESSNLLYFAQLLEELLFDFSLDTYKPSAMNTSLLCIEALETIYEIDQGNIKSPNLQYILEELCENLKKDVVAHNSIDIDLDGVYPILKNPKIDMHEKRIVVELLSEQLNAVKYKQKNESLLEEAILSDENNFSNIRSLTRIYITTLINIGYSSKYIYNFVQQFFFYGSNRIMGNLAISDFINKFKSENDEYLILYRGSPVFQEIKKSCEGLNISITKKFENLDFDISSHNFNLRNDEVYICVDQVKARDQFVAKEEADKRLELLNTLFTLFHHKQHIKYLNDCIIINKNNTASHKSKVFINSMHKCIDLKPPKAASMLNQFISDFSLEPNSFKRFTRSAELHSLALGSDSKENQMINLWIALESIIPAKSNDKGISNIEHIINSTIPFLSIGYLDRLISRFTRDLFNWDKIIIKKYINDIDDKSTIKKIVKLMMLPEFEAQINCLLSEFKDFHLIKDRFIYFCNILNSPKNVAKLIENHNQRVSWQIRRIYRARNLIVHSGKTPSYTEILVENTHDYLDIIMRSLMRLATNPKAIRSIDQGFKYTELSYFSIFKWLNKKDSKFDESTINLIIDKKVL